MNERALVQMDSWHALAKKTYYEDFVTRCEVCGEKFTFSASAQKHVFEVVGVPVKYPMSGRAVFLRQVPAREARQVQRT